MWLSSVYICGMRSNEDLPLPLSRLPHWIISAKLFSIMSGYHCPELRARFSSLPVLRNVVLRVYGFWNVYERTRFYMSSSGFSNIAFSEIHPGWFIHMKFYSYLLSLLLVWPTEQPFYFSTFFSAWKCCWTHMVMWVLGVHHIESSVYILCSTTSVATI